jgi:NADPH:quinone reductase-like Zn-dependent oxidoreductase
MRAIVHDVYGGPEVLELREVDKPELADDGVLVRVHAASVNPYDWHMLTGMPYMVRAVAGLRRPKNGVVGVDYAGTVEAVGAERDDFESGDEVFGTRNGSLAEYVCARKGVARKPRNVSFEEAAAAPMAALTALQGLRNKGAIKPGQKVLVNGASGGVGTYAVQLAKWFGAEVTGVCRTRNVELVRSLGADRVIDYTQDDFTREDARYDLILDVAGNHTLAECKRVLTDEGVVVAVGGPKTNKWVGPLGVWLLRRVASIPGKQSVATFVTKLNVEDLELVRDLLASGAVKSVVERRYDLSDAPEALAYVGTGHAQAKVIVSVAAR